MSSVAARSGSSPSSAIRFAVIHQPTRKAVASITPKELMENPKIEKSSGYILPPLSLREARRASKLPEYQENQRCGK